MNASSCALLLCVVFAGCRGAAPTAKPAAARNLILVTIDTLRADHVGAYGYARSQASFVDAIAQQGVTFGRAFAAAPITLPSHATLMTGRYPPGHGSRDNGMRVSPTVPTLASELKAHGFRTAAFVGAFPLDHQFGLDRGFDVYSDRMPRGPDGKQANERPAAQVVDEAIAWIGAGGMGGTGRIGGRGGNDAVSVPALPAPPAQRFFLWLHVFEPHAPYGDASDRRPVLDRYDQEIGVANRELMRLRSAIDGVARDTLMIVAGDHGEAFGEHGEFSHSIFVYDTTLRVPLVMRGPGITNHEPRTTNLVITDPVTLADVAPTAMRLLGFTMADADGVDLSPVLTGGALPRREIYAESFAPLMEFGWAPLRVIRSGPWKFIAAPKPELFDVDKDADERTNLVASQPTIARDLDTRAGRVSPPRLPSARAIDASGLERLRALGYANGRPRLDEEPGAVDPKDRREVAARIAQVTSGELSGAALIAALEQILEVDAGNGQAHLRLGFALLQSDNCPRAEREFTAAIDGGLPGTDAQLGLANCLGRRNDLAGAERVLKEARRREPDNPVLTANLGILQAAKGDLSGAIATLTAALAADPNLHEARFNLALAFAKSNRRAEAAAAARDLLARLPASAPQRAEVERLLKAVQ